MGDAPPKPIAWQHDVREVDVIHDKVKQLWLAVKPKHVEHYTIPLYGPKP